MGSQLARAMIEATVCVGSGRRSSFRNRGAKLSHLGPVASFCRYAYFRPVQRV
jgi:hypothetical protein